MDPKEKTGEMRVRLRLWEQGQIDELLERVETRQNLQAERRKVFSDEASVGDRERLQGRRALKCTTKGRHRKAMMSFSEKGRVEATAAEKTCWAETLIPRSERPDQSCGVTETEKAWLLANHAHGSSDAIMYKYLAVASHEGQVPIIPVPSFPALSAPGPTGERAEHLRECTECRHVGAKRRFYRALDLLTVKAARGALPSSAKWLLNTALVFLKKGDGDEAADDDQEWLWQFQADTDRDDAGSAASDSLLTEDVIERETAVSTRRSSDDQSPMDVGPPSDDSPPSSNQERTETSKKPLVRPIQMGELLRKTVSKRILAAARGGVDAACLGARQWGVGADGGAEAIVHTHLAIERMFFGGMLDKPIAIVQVDADNCFGRLEWGSIRAEVAAEVPELGPVVAWKHTHDSYVEQPDAQPQLKNRGAGTRWIGAQWTQYAAAQTTQRTKYRPMEAWSTSGCWTTPR
jgi:hypothetical protein